jgi:hypothetical protein
LYAKLLTHARFVIKGGIVQQEAEDVTSAAADFYWLTEVKAASGLRITPGSRATAHIHNTKRKNSKIKSRFPVFRYNRRIPD